MGLDGKKKKNTLEEKTAILSKMLNSQIGNSANKAENPSSYKPNILPGTQSWDPMRVFGVEFEVGSPCTSPGGLGARYALGVLNGDEISLSL